MSSGPLPGGTGERITRKSGSNLALSFICLPKEQRQAMSVFYAFCRVVDDVVDETTAPLPMRQARLHKWRDDIRAIYHGTPEQPLAKELAPVVRQYLIPPEPLLEILDGVEMDLTKDRYDTFEELRKYCYGVASAVGLVSINIFCCQTRAARDYAIALGMAFQLTNILRDVAYDLQRFGRIYLPREEWKTFGVTEEDFRRPNPTPGMARLLRMQYFRARHYFEKADRLLPEADRPHLSAALLMTGVYRDLLEKIRRRNFEVLKGPIKLSRWEKLMALRRGQRALKKQVSPRRAPARIAVIGGGYAGCAAAFSLAREGHLVDLIEAKPQLGGRAHSYREAKTGTILDNGQHILMGCYHRTLEMVAEMGNLDRLDRHDRLDLHFVSPKKGRTILRASPLPPPFHLLAGLFGFQELTWLDRWAILNLPGRAQSQPPKQGETVQAWLERVHQTPGSIRALWEPFCLAALNAPIQLADSCLFWEVTRRGLFGSSRDAAIYLDKDGLSGLLSPELNAFLTSAEGRVRTASPVEELRYDEIHQRVEVVKFKDGTEEKYDVVVLAVPWTPAAKMIPSVDRASQLAAMLKPGPILGVHLWTDRPLTPDLITGFLDSPLHWVFDRTSTLPPGSSGHLYAAVISAVTDLIDQTGKYLVDLILGEIQRMVPESREAKVTHHVVYKSRDATFWGQPGMPLARPGPVTSVENLFLAGDWTATGLPATIEGAVLSGFRAAAAVG
ncbi:MAG: hydroxysqualene dehydroxylase HpnE [Candidatus Methylacidiphilales bacterium]